MAILRLLDQFTAFVGWKCGLGGKTKPNEACAKLSWRDSAGIQSCPAKVSRPAGIDVDVSGGNEWCEASQIADGQPQRK